MSVFQSRNERNPHNSLPLRGGRWRRRRRMRANHTVKSLLKVILAMFAQRTEGFPLGGKKTASSLSRKRLMRGINLHLQKAYIPYAPRSPIRREAELFTALAPPNPPKNFPARQPPSQKREKFSHTNSAVAVQESSGWVREVWRVGRPLRKGSPCASKVFPKSSPVLSPCICRS